MKVIENSTKSSARLKNGKGIELQMIILSASVLSADCANFERDIKRVENVAQWLHLDVMDGHFVPNISYGVPVVSAINRITDMFLDVHLMITDPIDYIEQFAKAGADMITFHAEANSDIDETIKKIKSHGIKCGLAAKPKTPVDKLLPYINEVDMILQMTVEPGFGGQSMIESAVESVREYRRLAPNLDIQVDGGVNQATASVVSQAGANVLVAGSAIFHKENPEQAATDIINACKVK